MIENTVEREGQEEAAAMEQERKGTSDGGWETPAPNHHRPDEGKGDDDFCFLQFFSHHRFLP